MKKRVVEERNMDPRMVHIAYLTRFDFTPLAPAPNKDGFPQNNPERSVIVSRSGCKDDNLRSCRLNFALERKTRKDRGYSNTDKDLLWDIYKGDHIGGNKRHAG